MQRAELEEKQSEQQTLLYEQRAQQAKLTQALNERKKDAGGAGIFHPARSAAAK